MTPVERIIVKWYSANTFMFDNTDDRYYADSLKEEILLNIQKELMESKHYLSVKQIQEKFKYLRDTFVKSDLKLANQEDLTYFQKCIYERMFFFKMYITHKADDQLSKYETMTSIKVNESSTDAVMKERIAFLKIVKENQVIQDKADLLNDIITSKQSNKAQRLCFLFILKAIKDFKNARKDD